MREMVTYALRDFTLTFAADACLGVGFLSPYCVYRKYLSALWRHPVSTSFDFPYFLAVFIFQPSQHGCSAAALGGAWFAPDPPTRGPSKSGRRALFSLRVGRYAGRALIYMNTCPLSTLL